MPRYLRPADQAADPLAVVACLAAALRAAGAAADPTRTATCVTALGHVDVLDRVAVYWACRVSLCSDPDDLARFDAIFDAVFGAACKPAAASRSARVDAAAIGEPGGPAGTADKRAADSAHSPSDQVLGKAASTTRALRHRDVATLSAAERAQIAGLVAALRPQIGTRRSSRYRPGGRERHDMSRTVRAMVRSGGEPALLAQRRRRLVRRRLVLLLDVSGSMAPYSEMMLRFAHAAVRVSPRSEAFTVSGTLTRITRQLRLRDPDLALAAAGSAVPDWSGGTRLGESLQAFLDRWGQRGTARQAVVVIASDGWERGDAALLSEQMRRLSRLARTVVWVNPHRGKDGFVAATAGMQAALPYVDRLVAGHSLQAMLDVVEVIADA